MINTTKRLKPYLCMIPIQLYQFSGLSVLALIKCEFKGRKRSIQASRVIREEPPQETQFMIKYEHDKYNQHIISYWPSLIY